MLVRALHELLSLPYTPAYAWVCGYLDVEHLDYFSVQNLQLCCTCYEGSPRHRYLNDQDIFSSLLESKDKILSTKLAWFLLRHYDIYDETDELVHDYLVANGFVVEYAPFLCGDFALILTCATVKCNREKNKVRDFTKVTGENGLVSLQLSLNDPTLRDLLFGRLRSYVSHE